MLTCTLIYILLEGVYEISGNHICMTWTIQRNQLLLKCKMLYIVNIKFTDMFENEVASCPFRYGECVTKFENVTVQRNYRDYETTLIVKGIVDERVNGIWSCHDLSHPEFYDSVNVTSHTGIPGADDPKVYLSGPNKVNVNTEFVLICTTTKAPGILVTEFVENSEIYTKMRKNEDVCYSSLHETACSAGVCHCTDDKMSYVITHKGYPYKSILAFKCSIEFESIGRISSTCKFVTVVESTINNDHSRKTEGFNFEKLLLSLSIGSVILIVLVVAVVLGICIRRRRRTFSIQQDAPQFSRKRHRSKYAVEMLEINSNVRTSQYDEIDEDDMIQDGVSNIAYISIIEEDRQCDSQHSSESSDYEVVNQPPNANRIHLASTYKSLNLCHPVDKQSKKRISIDGKKLFAEEGNEAVHLDGYMTPYNALKRSQTAVPRYESVMVNESDVYSTECNLIKSRPKSF